MSDGAVEQGLESAESEDFLSGVESLVKAQELAAAMAGGSGEEADVEVPGSGPDSADGVGGGDGGGGGDKAVEAGQEGTKVDEPEAASESPKQEAEEKKSAPLGDRAAKKFAYLAKQEKEIREKQEALKRQQEEAAPALELIAALQRGDYSAIEKIAGPDAHKNWTKQLLSKGEITAEQRVDALEKRLQEEKEQAKIRADEEAKKQSEEDRRSLEEYQVQLSDEAAKSPIVGVHPGLPGLAVGLFWDEANKPNGKFLTPEEATAATEQLLRDVYAKLKPVMEAEGSEEPAAKTEPAAIKNPDLDAPATVQEKKKIEDMSQEEVTSLAINMAAELAAEQGE